MNEVDPTRLTLGFVAGSRQSAATTKTLQFQVVTVDSGNGTDAGFSDAFGQWCMFAPPLGPARDASGVLTGACNVIVVEGVPNRPTLGTMDTRVAVYGQDAKPGEVVLTNYWGSRWLLGQNSVALSAGGGFINFDIAGKKLTISGIPSKAGGAAPYISADSAQIGMVSATGAASVNVGGSVVTVSGGSIALDAGSVAIGKGASDPMVLHSLLLAQFAVLSAWLMSHVHTSAAAGSPTSPPLVPMSFSSHLGSLRVKTS